MDAEKNSPVLSTETQVWATSSDTSSYRQGDQTEKTSFPDGGFKAWCTVAGTWLVLFSTFGYLYSFGVYQDFYVREFLSGYSPSKIAWIGSFQLMMPFALGIITGKLFDEGYFHAVEIFGSMMFTFSLFMLSLAKPDQYYQVFLSQGIGMGIGLGFTFVPTAGICLQHFHRHRALASGISFTGISLGAVVFPIMLNHLIPKIGFGQAVRASAYIVLGCLLLGNSLMRTGVAKSKTASPDIKSFFKDPPYLWSILVCLVSTFGAYFPIMYLQLYAVQHNLGENLAFYSLSIVNASSIIGRIGGNHLADMYGYFNMYIPITFIMGATIWAILGVNSPASLIVVSILYGISSGAWLAMAVVTLSSLARSPNESGIGVALALGSFGSLGSAPVQGALLTNDFLWRRPIAFSGSLVLISGFILIIVRSYLVKERGTRKL